MMLDVLVQSQRVGARCEPLSMLTAVAVLLRRLRVWY